MRKLSKKISMLMVLAMLVSLFSGVVSASAASKWSFYDRTADEVVEVKDTYVMEKNQYANFDLYCEGEEADTDTYEYTWASSDPDVVYVDATNGRLRADKYGKAEAGDKAFVYVLIDNKTTEKNENAKRGFYIEIAADEVVEEPVEVDYKIATNIVPDEVYYVGEKYELEAVVTADGEEIEAEVVFSIDGTAVKEFAPAKVGEYTIVATATIDGEEYFTTYKVTAEAKALSIVDIEQVELNKIRVIFSDKAYAAEALAAANADIEEVFELSFNADKDDKEGGYRVDHELYMASKDAVNDNCVYITTYKKLEENLKYKLSYKKNGEEVAWNWVTGTGIIPDRVEVKEKGYVVGDYRALEYVVYNKNEVIINSIPASQGGFDADMYPVEWELVGEQNDKFDFDGYNSKIYFVEKNAEATVKVTIDMGYDENAQKVADKTDVGTVWGTDATDIDVVPVGYKVATVRPADNGFVGATEPQKFFVGQGDVANGGQALFLYAYYNVKDANGNVSKKYIEKGLSTDANNFDVFTYQSSNTDIVAVDEEDGQIYPVAVGIARVYIKSEGKVLGYATVQVLKQQELFNFDVKLTAGAKTSVVADTEVLNHHGIASQVVKVEETYKDQLGADLPLAGTVEYELLSPIKTLDGTVVYEGATGFDALFSYDDSAANKTFTPDSDTFATSIIAPGKKLTVKVKATVTFTCKDNTEIEKVDTFSFQLKNIKGVKAKDPVLNVTSTVDMNLSSLGDGDNLGKRTGDITLTQSDAEDFFVRELPFAVINDDTQDTKATTAGDYTVVITKGDVALDDTQKIKRAPELWVEICTAGDCATGSMYKVTVDPMIVSGNQILKADTGMYKVRLYKGDGTTAKLVTTKTMNIKDTTPAIKIQKVSEWIDSYFAMGDLAEAIKFFRGTAELKYDDDPTNGGLDLFNLLNVDYDYKTDNTDRVYIYSIKVNVPVKAYNDKWGNAVDYTEETIIIDKTFTEK